MRTKKLIWNTISSLALQIITLICGFVLPPLIMHSYGSKTNGLVNSIAQFLQVISLLEFGVSAVIQSALYKPLVTQDNVMLSRIMTSGGRFFRNIGKILFVYIVILLVGYPRIVRDDFSYVFTAILIISMSISSFAQYYFGLTDQLLLEADQRAYLYNITQILAIITNTFCCVVLMKCKFSIQIVKSATSVIFLIRPIILRYYVRHHYEIERNISYDTEPIEQKWNGVAQHIAAFVLSGTDSIVLTFFASLSDVSIYSVYNMIISGVKQLFMSLTAGIQPVFGEMLAKGEMKQLNLFFSKVEWLVHTGVTFVFGCTAVLIIPFVKVYTTGVHDADYNVPFFALILTLGNAFHCLRLPYSMMILAAGHYRQTQNNYIIAALMNIVISVILVRRYGLVGVAVGTFVAMVYQTIWMAYYTAVQMIQYPFVSFVKQIFVDFISFMLAWFLGRNIGMRSCTYWSWVVTAFLTSIVWIIAILSINLMFYPDNVKYFKRKIRSNNK